MSLNAKRMERTLGKKMGVDENVDVEGVEKGETSHPESIKEIRKDDFKVSKHPRTTLTPGTTNSTSISMATATISTTKTTTDSSSRYWMKDLYKYSYPRSYAASGLYNLAWAQAVQNKPLNEVLVELKPDEEVIPPHGGEERNTSSRSVNTSAITGSMDDTNSNTKSAFDDTSGDLANKAVVIDCEEEGELEEGEIDLDSEPMESEEKETDGVVSGGFEIEMDDGELEKQVDSIRDVVENVTSVEAEKSFDLVCNRLRNSLKILNQLVLHSWFPTKDVLIQQSLAVIQCVTSVFCSMSREQREQNKNGISRLLNYVLSLDPAFFPPQQMKEIEAFMLSISSPGAPPHRTKPGDKQDELAITDKAILTDANTLSVNTGHNLSSLGNDELDSSFSAFVKKGLRPIASSNIKARVGISPLLDLHKVHDEDSLPSPTHKSSSPFLVTQRLPVADVVVKLDSTTTRVMNETENIAVHPYETDALKAVSSYQQKFGRTTFLLNDRLPSPTPSEESKQGETDEIDEEALSCYASSNIETTTPPVLSQPIISSATSVNYSVVPGLLASSSTVFLGPGSNPTFQATPKRRDPRLRYINSDLGTLDLKHCPDLELPTSGTKSEPLRELLSSKKHSAAEVPVFEGPALKKQRNGQEITEILVDKNEAPTFCVSKGLENRGIVGPEFVKRSQSGAIAIDPRKLETGVICSGTDGINSGTTISRSGQSAVSSTSPSLQYLLSNMTVNPVAWMNIFMEQKQSSDPAKSVLHSVNSSSILGAGPLSNVTPPSSTGTGQNTAGLAQNESAKIRMKPRDPRRALHTSSIQKSGSSAMEHSKTNEALLATIQVVKENSLKLVNGTNISAAPSQSNILPDIAKQFNQNMKNIADMMSVSPTSVVPSTTHQNSSQLKQIYLENRTGGAVNSSNQPTGYGLKPEEGAGPTQSPSIWVDVEHLFEGYDNQQKAAIQLERARRIEEQKKMFAARKLCLVLDLDHTLLNSAKFSEVDPIHDEILRKKEEQDREKLQRHLFRFPHMGMWTKLRPGIWNFLEKASKLYELHLYTMGNKLYATEMAKVLDPKGVLFAGRVISRGDDEEPFDGDERVPKSKDLDGVLGMESAVVIIDDSVRVWPHNKLNLIVVERYTYFPCSRRQFGLAGPSLLEIDHDERPEDGTLASSLQVIERIHQNFFSNKLLDDVDVRNILASEQQKILAGCHIVFSRVFPVGEANPHLHPLWQTAEQFGAVCTNQIDEQVTHVVANSLGTDKVNWALSTGRHVVNPGWVEASALLYRRANEQDFAIKS
ncbi:hypothetical protein Nepgr_003954 [Nepenthes gracilis]|uniref:protein-serine/threonine phosphatase n=1 Tax=Nepenthes gracilis TaxID=150966 RepID=A0AAD3XEL3_NEPGR|nr:hypothetical protein Nepgr_003954 [Nepenthes gracilis]